MEWIDEALVLAVRPHGETAAIGEFLTREHGRHVAFVHGGRSRRNRPVLQIGNHVEITWRARLADQLGYANVALRRGFAGEVMNDRLALAGLSSMAAMARILPEREPQASLYEVALFVLGFMDDPEVWPALYVRWELALLVELGFGLELDACAVTGVEVDLTHVSPNSGRAVSRSAGEPYRDRLLVLPPFLRGGDRGPIARPDVVAGLELTGHFLVHRILAPRDRDLPDVRLQLADLLARGQ